MCCVPIYSVIILLGPNMVTYKMISKLLLTFLFTATAMPHAMGNSDLLQVTNGNNQFAHNFYSTISKEEKGNILFSPLSLHTLLSMIYQGAAGETANKLATSLNVPNQNLAASGYEITMAKLNSLKDVTLHMANKIYITKQFTLKPNFKQVITKSFSSEVEPIDFSASDAAAKEMNQWVESKTNSKIKNLIDPQTLSGATRLVLINAVYFKGGWMYPFSKEDTTTESFYVSKHETIDCQMMRLEMPLYHRHDMQLEAQVLKLQYSNEKISLVIILPNDKDGIAILENKLVNVDLSNITNHMSRMFMINAALPKFRIETTMNLKPILEQMDLGVIFKPSADFSEITENSERVSVSEATQKTFIEVNEEGTEAAAATNLRVYLSGPRQFKADHPFIILLQTEYEGVTNTLFYGKIMKPNYN